MTKLNTQRFLLITVIGSIVMYIFEFLMHGGLLKADYLETAKLWRTPVEMMAMMDLSLTRPVIFNLVLAFIFTRNYEGTGIGEGVRFGLYLGSILGIALSSQYLWMPITSAIALKWFAIEVLLCVGLGVVYSLLYRKPA